MRRSGYYYMRARVRVSKVLKRLLLGHALSATGYNVHRRAGARLRLCLAANAHKNARSFPIARLDPGKDCMYVCVTKSLPGYYTRIVLPYANWMRDKSFVRLDLTWTITYGMVRDRGTRDLLCEAWLLDSWVERDRCWVGWTWGLWSFMRLCRSVDYCINDHDKSKKVCVGKAAPQMLLSGGQEAA